MGIKFAKQTKTKAHHRDLNKEEKEMKGKFSEKEREGSEGVEEFGKISRSGRRVHNESLDRFYIDFFNLIFSKIQ